MIYVISLHLILSSVAFDHSCINSPFAESYCNNILVICSVLMPKHMRMSKQIAEPMLRSTKKRTSSHSFIEITPLSKPTGVQFDSAIR